MITVKIEDGTIRIFRHLPIISFERLRCRQKEKYFAHEGLHNHAVVNTAASRSRKLSAAGIKLEVTIRAAQHRLPVTGIRPGMPVEIIERDTAQFRCESPKRIAIDGYVHDDGFGLLNLSNASQFNFVREPCSDVTGSGFSIHKSGRNSRQEEEDAGSGDKDQHKQN